MAQKKPRRTRQPAAISTSVGDVLRQAQEQKRRETAAAMRRVAGAA